MKQDQEGKTSQRIKEVYEWASFLAVENRDKGWTRYYYWTEPAKRLLLRLRHLRRGLVALVGLQGTGKTSTLTAIAVTLLSEGSSIKMWKWRSGIPQQKLRTEFGECRYIFFDLPDYTTRSSRQMMKHLDDIGQLWHHFRDRDMVFLITAQKELFTGHYLLGKMSIIELTPLKPQELLEAYKKRFKTTEPFTEEALILTAELSRGVFRRFLKYIQLSLEESLLTEKETVDKDLVSKTITLEQLAKDMDLELSGILKDQEKKLQAVKILNILREKGEINQKTIAQQLNLHEATLARLLDKLETQKYIKRTRGTKKELLVQLT